MYKGTFYHRVLKYGEENQERCGLLLDANREYPQSICRAHATFTSIFIRTAESLLSKGMTLKP